MCHAAAKMAPPVDECGTLVCVAVPQGAPVAQIARVVLDVFGHWLGYMGGLGWEKVLGRPSTYNAYNDDTMSPMTRTLSVSSFFFSLLLQVFSKRATTHRPETPRQRHPDSSRARVPGLVDLSNMISSGSGFSIFRRTWRIWAGQCRCCRYCTYIGHRSCIKLRLSNHPSFHGPCNTPSLTWILSGVPAGPSVGCFNSALCFRS
ncbi:hypothetical protein BD289DRAFT_448940 [Coniella lustricola]|uniref:Uncharacterized protein n=1 Tax=Coniella lustricola TaxID=2025994 RepID=A0A2T2ZRP1_9PEZI|nr:hypothetical protein BD289DRAFT_448940 [Coniella lustricola]